MESISSQVKEMLEEKKVFKSGNLFKCILGLNELESNVLSYLLKHDNVSTNELTDTLKKDRSSIQRALANLIELNVITRRAMPLKEYNESKGSKINQKRGYLYVYGARDLESIKKEFLDLLDKWHDSMVKYIEGLDSLFDCYENDGELC